MRSSLAKKYIGNRAFYAMALAVAVPIMVQNGITQFVSLLDNIMVGRVGEAEMRGVGVANTLIFVFNLAIFGAVSGAGIFGAQYFGRGDHEGVRHAFRFKLYIGALLLLLGVAVFAFFGDELIRLYLLGEGTEAEREASFQHGRNYLRIMLVGFLPFVLSQCYSGTLRECGQTIVPMISGIVSVLVNLCFNTLLIFGYLGFPKLGAEGAAIATVIARYVEAAVVIVWAHANPKKAPYMVGAYRTLRIPGALAGQIAKKTLPLMLNETLWALGMALLTQCYSLSSLTVGPANTISSTVSNVFNVAFLAMGNAIGIIVGQLLGADKPDEAVDTDRKLIVFSVVICFLIGGVMAALSPVIPLMYNATDAVRDLASDFLLILALTMPINALANACYFTLRSGGKTFITFLFDSFYVCVFTVPLAYGLHFLGLSIVPLFLFCQLADIGKCVLGLIMIKKGMWINNIVKEQNHEHRVLPEA